MGKRKLDIPIDQYFKERILKEEVTDCWLWQLGLDRDGYGNCFHWINVQHGKQKAHQFSYIHHYGPIPKGLVVRHKCRNRSCCNPQHLEIGTQLDNIRDMIRDGTKLFGK